MKILFAGGGTAGHINPALSIADYMKKREKDFSALFIGTKRGLETELVPRAGYEIRYIDIRGFDRRNPFANIEVVKKLITARADCERIIKEFRPDAVVCTGGYVSGPAAMAAKKCGVPSLIHEQNVYPGMTVRGAQRYVDYVAVSFAETVRHLSKKSKCVVTGNPVREEILTADREKCREKPGIGADERLVLIFGGSLGAARLNSAVCEMLPRLCGNPKIRVLFGTGTRNYKDVCAALGNVGANVTLTPYINNMAEVMAASDVAVTRAGAITVSELACMHKPAVLVPSPNVVRNHQEQNAHEFEKAGAAIMLKEVDLSGESLYNAVMGLASDDAALAKMAERMGNFAERSALEKTARLIYTMTGAGK